MASSSTTMREALEAADIFEQRAGSTALLTIPQAAAYLQIGQRTLKRWIAQGKLPVHKLSTRCHRITRADLDDFLARST